MENILERLKIFVDEQIESYNNIEEPYKSREHQRGYVLALIDIKDFIKFKESENKLIGKWGYFWNEEDSGNCTFGYLLDISNGFYICKSRINDNILFDNFLTTIPPHLK